VDLFSAFSWTHL